MEKRETFSVKIRAELKKKFLDTVKQKGLSTCYVIEAFMTAWLEGIKTGESGQVIPGSTLKLVLQRVVQRVRRKTTYYVPEPNHFCPVKGWYYDDSHPNLVVVEQPFEWGENKCAEGFVYTELADGRKCWVKVVQ